MRKSSELYADYWENGNQNGFVHVNVSKSVSSNQYDWIDRVELPPLNQWTNKETYSAFLRWAADRIDEVPYNRPTYEGDMK